MSPQEAIVRYALTGDELVTRWEAHNAYLHRFGYPTVTFLTWYSCTEWAK